MPWIGDLIDDRHGFSDTYLSEEPVDFQWPEAREGIEEEGVGVSDVVRVEHLDVFLVLIN